MFCCFTSTVYIVAKTKIEAYTINHYIFLVGLDVFVCVYYVGFCFTLNVNIYIYIYMKYTYIYIYMKYTYIYIYIQYNKYIYIHNTVYIYIIIHISY